MTTHPLPESISTGLVHLRSPGGDIAAIIPYGAHVLSWVTADGDERLFLSPKAEFREGVAIRGGTPVIFPQFADMGGLAKHGFARNLAWQVVQVGADRAIFQLTDSQATRAAWPHRFQVEYIVLIEDGRLKLNLSVTNPGDVPYSFTAALHTYLRVQDLSATTVLGLAGLSYLDAVNGGRELVEVAGRVAFPGEVDRLYQDVPAWLTLAEPGRELRIDLEGFPDAVIWNPGPQKCARLGDMEPDGYLRFVCVEAAAAARPVILSPGACWQGAQILSAGRLPLL